jgi:hypothetical protein
VGCFDASGPRSRRGGPCSVIAHTFTPTPCRTLKEYRRARLTMPVAAPPPDDITGGTNGAEKPVPSANRTPALAHRMKHDKSILALAVSSHYIFAGTQGGEILVCSSDEIAGASADMKRSTASTRTSGGESSRRTKAVYSACVCRKTASCCFRARQIRLSM